MAELGATTTTDEVLDGVDLAGKRFVVTGASTGLGEETTRAVAAHGAAVTMAARDIDKGLDAADRIRESVPDADLVVRELDLASLASVHSFAEQFLAERDRIDVLINNAGVMACPHATTSDGFEMQFGTNHLGHFLLTTLLTPALLAGSPARVVALSSRGHRLSDVDLDDPDFARTPYDPWVAYGRSKTANVLFAVGFDQRHRDQGVRSFAVHPGGIRTELGRHLTEESINALVQAMPPGQQMEWKTIPQGAATSVWAATSPTLGGKGGLYLEDCGIAEPVDEVIVSGVQRYAIDPDRADALWTLSESLVGSA
jgi:NAD(P)-dependent dehydrogenase (short-subunit alcohol dehydrogenase family)